MSENLEEWRLRVYGKELKDEIDLRRSDPQAWRRGSRKSKPKTSTWLWPVLLLLSAIFITAALL